MCHTLRRAPAHKRAKSTLRSIGISPMAHDVLSGLSVGATSLVIVSLDLQTVKIRLFESRTKESIIAGSHTTTRILQKLPLPDPKSSRSDHSHASKYVPHRSSCRPLSPTLRCPSFPPLCSRHLSLNIYYLIFASFLPNPYINVAFRQSLPKVFIEFQSIQHLRKP